MSPGPLSGRGIVVTRPREHAAGLAECIRAAGGSPFLFPTIEILPVENTDALAALIARLDRFQLAIFVSPTAVMKGHESVIARRAWPAQLRAAAVGSGTARALERAGFRDVISPSGQADSEALAALPELQDMRGREAAIFRGQGGREWLRATLEARGARVEYAECYRRARPSTDPGPLLARWQSRGIEAASITSAEGLANFFDMLGPVGGGYLRATPVFVPHPRIAKAAKEFGVREVVVTGRGDEQTVSEMTAFLLRCERTRRSRMEDSTPPGSAMHEPSKRARWQAWPLALGLGFVALLLLWQWYDGRGRMDALREEVARRLRDSDAESRDARLVARQAQDSVLEAQARLAQLELKLAESQSQQVALEALYQELSRSRDDWVLAEIEQILSIASQQLQLAGNVQAALAALQAADARLARSDRPQFTPLRKVFARDIERLKAAPALDVPGIAAKLDQLIAGVDSLPLAQEARPAAGAAAAQPRAETGVLSRLWADFLAELKQLVRVENVDRADPALLSPSQAFYLRENLKLRLLNARLALLARDEATFRSDLSTAVAWLGRYFDARSPAAGADLAVLKQLGSGATGNVLPTIGESLAAVRGFKASRERAR